MVTESVTSGPRAPGGPDLEGRRALPDVPEAHPRALLPRRGARHRGRPQRHRLGRVAARAALRVSSDPDGVGLVIEWFRTRYVFQPGSPTPFLPAERRLIEIIVQALDLRFRGLFDPEVAHRLERFHYALGGPDRHRLPRPARPVPRARGARGAAGRRAVDLREPPGLDRGAPARHRPRPGRPGWVNPEGAPRFNARLTAIKGFHRLCDGVRTVFLVDRQGDLARAVDIDRWAEQRRGSEPLVDPCPRAYVSHAKATRSGGHVCLVLTPSQEIKVFAEGTLTFSFSDARWRLLDIPTKFAGLVRGRRPVVPRATWPRRSSRPR